jgi:hypothetical protein
MAKHECILGIETNIALVLNWYYLKPLLTRQVWIPNTKCILGIDTNKLSNPQFISL